MHSPIVDDGLQFVVDIETPEDEQEREAQLQTDALEMRDGCEERRRGHVVLGGKRTAN